MWVAKDQRCASFHSPSRKVPEAPTGIAGCGWASRLGSLGKHRFPTTLNGPERALGGHCGVARQTASAQGNAAAIVNTISFGGQIGPSDDMLFDTIWFFFDKLRSQRRKNERNAIFFFNINFHLTLRI